MREILFRGKRIDSGEWVCGSFCMDAREQFNGLCGVDGFIRLYDKDKGKMQMHEVERESIGQFTGLTDKNGKKIFEGDIGKYKQTDGAKRNGKPIICIGKVIYNAKTASFAIESKDKAACKYFDYFQIKDFEVIGNIHDNPEL